MDPLPSTSAAKAAEHGGGQCSAPKASATPALARLSPRMRLILFLVPFTLVLVVAATIGIALRGGFGGQELPKAAARRAPVAVTPPAAPPPASFALAGPATDASAAAPTSQSPDRIAALAKDLAPRLKDLPADRAAPASLLVLPGDRRTVDAASRLPRHERWEIQFPSGNTVDSYSRQLDFFKIELGVIGASQQAICISNLSAPAPTTREQQPGAEQRLYLIWQRGAMREADEELLRRAKIDPQGKVVLHFCPPELEAQLVQLEDQHARQARAAKVRKTIFGIKSNDTGGYQFHVLEQKADAS